MISFIAKVSKGQNRKLIHIPKLVAAKYDLGEYVIVRKIDPEEVKKWLKTKDKGQLCAKHLAE